MTRHFTHIHLHTDYSLLDGAIGIDRLVSFGKKNDFKALAITDHGNIFGAVKFFQKCKKEGIKPILGMEAYLTEDAGIKDAANKYYHLILLVQNAQGYKNLCKLIAFSYQDGFYFKPRIDYRMLEKHSQGLIATSACLGGHIPSLLMHNELDKVHERLDWFTHTFGKDRFYLEVQPEDHKEQSVLNQKLYALSAEKNVPLVAAGDCHYVEAQDHEAHEIMLAIQTHDKLDNPNRYTFGDCRVYMRTAEQMLTIFKEHEAAVWNSGIIADSCDFAFETNKLFFPQFAIPEPYTTDEYFRQLCTTGLKKLISTGYIAPDKETIYSDRLTLEMDLIIKMGFVGYFLVVSDFIQWAHAQGIPVGPGRGSAAGSLVAWTLQITNIDPIAYNLLFERFLNPERISMPDIDIDFCIEGRDRVIEYVRNRYGHDKVCHIITFGTMMAKGVIKDVARVLGLAFEDSNAITNLIPDQLKITLEQALEQEPRLQEMVQNNAMVKKIFDIAFKLEGLTRHASKHAAGIVISPEPIAEVLPVYVPAKSNELVAQYAMTELETIGFLKIDFLGLKNLTLIARAVEIIAKNYQVTIDINKLPLDDAQTFALIGAGKTSGVFQLESQGLKEVLRKLQPEKFEDIIAVNALYRPGPLGSGMVDDFIERRHGKQKITYIFPELEEVLAETYGVIVYQEQVMKIASTIGGYSLGEADILRRAMGKKKAEVMAEQKAIFTSRSKERGFNGEKAGELFDLMAYFAGYGFNKSHSAAYALIAYQTAYLKAHYPAEFMACLISLEADTPDTMAEYLQDAKDMGIALLAPDINRSELNFTVYDNAILFGLRGIKNVGHIAIENIIAQRIQKPFTDLFDFCKRIDLRTANKRVVEHLICAGAFDALPGNRAQKFNELPALFDRAIAYKNDAKTGQMGLFGVAKQDSNAAEYYNYEPREEWPSKEKLEKEKEVIGFYLSAHPLEVYNKQIRWLGINSFQTILEKYVRTNNDQAQVIACGSIKTKKEIVTKKGERMAFIQFEDSQAIAEVIVFPKLFAQVAPSFENNTVFVVKGTVDLLEQKQCKIKAQELIPIDLIFDENTHIKQLHITIPNTQEITDDYVQKIRNVLQQGSIRYAFIFTENNKTLQLLSSEKIVINKQMLEQLEDLNAQISCLL